MKAVLHAAALAAASAAAPSLTVLPQAFADQYGAKCLDGTPPAFYSLIQDPSRATIFIEGGGWCFDATAAGTIQQCAGRAAGYLGTSKGLGASFDAGGTLSPNPAVNPDGFNRSLIFIHYCDGSSHSSGAIDPVKITATMRAELEAEGIVGVPSQIWFRGRANLIAVLQYLIQQGGLANVKEVVLSGGSAGAAAAYYAADFVREEIFPSNVQLTVAPDAGFFPDVENVAQNTRWYRNSFIGADPVWNSTASGGLNADCLAANEKNGTQWQCFMQQYAAQYITTPLMILNSAIDMWTVTSDMQLGCVPSVNKQPVAGNPTCNATQLQAIESLRQMMHSLLAPAINAYPNTGAFVDSCFVHEQNVDYCSTQPLPNCVGWNIYNVTAPGLGTFTMDAAFTAWHAAITSKYDEILAERLAHREKVVLPAIASGLAPPVSSNMLESAFAPQAGVVRIIDQASYPNNPSCPFPAK